MGRKSKILRKNDENLNLFCYFCKQNVFTYKVFIPWVTN